MSDNPLNWLPPSKNFLPSLRTIRDSLDDTKQVWDQIVHLANHRLNFSETNALDGLIARFFPDDPPAAPLVCPSRLAVLGSSTTTHLLPSIRVAAARRGIWMKTYACEYGQYRQELSDRDSLLREFRPDSVLLIRDAHHVTAPFHAGLSKAEVDANIRSAREDITGLWELIRESFGCLILQQTILPVFGSLIGNNEQRLPGSKAQAVTRLNTELRALADEFNIDLVALDVVAAQDGINSWHDPGLWHRAKQEVSPVFAPLYGDMVVRSLAARHGRSFKCLVLDLDDTIWGGAVGEDGPGGLVLGQGSPLGEAYLAVQDYAREQARRGIILAVCSKNDEANAVEPFERHPEMILKRSDIACFMANWEDKPANLRAIANSLGIGLDAMVFVDDNPFERELVRRELPMVAVPEVPEDPALVVRMLTAAGYFEAVAVTSDDRARGGRYQDNARREMLRTSSTDMAAYLRDLGMELSYRPFDDVGLKRVTQLINKTNQFNLTTRRYTEGEIMALIADKTSLGLQFRLKDVCGDTGTIGVVIMKPWLEGDPGDMIVDSWLMSCRVLGRGIEQATMNVVAAAAARLGLRRLYGEYRPSAKNRMVREHYVGLGFTRVDESAGGGGLFCLEISSYRSKETSIICREG